MYFEDVIASLNKEKQITRDAWDYWLKLVGNAFYYESKTETVEEVDENGDTVSVPKTWTDGHTYRITAEDAIAYDWRVRANGIGVTSKEVSPDNVCPACGKTI